jgi:hypothetical protein
MATKYKSTYAAVAKKKSVQSNYATFPFSFSIGDYDPLIIVRKEYSHLPSLALTFFCENFICNYMQVIEDTAVKDIRDKYKLFRQRWIDFWWPASCDAYDILSSSFLITQQLRPLDVFLENMTFDEFMLGMTQPWYVYGNVKEMRPFCQKDFNPFFYQPGVFNNFDEITWFIQQDELRAYKNLLS